MATKTQVDTPRSGSWAEQEATRPRIFKPSGSVIFQEADLLMLAQHNHPCYLSPEEAARGRQIAEAIYRSH